MPIVGKELDFYAFISILHKFSLDKIYLEKCQSTPGKGVSSMFTFGKHNGRLEGVIRTLKLPYKLVTPREWHSYAHEGISKKLKPKERSLIAIEQHYPETDFRKNEKCKVVHDGIAEAVLIGLYGLKDHYGV